LGSTRLPYPWLSRRDNDAAPSQRLAMSRLAAADLR
jgi:hypothetical protein